MYIMTDEGAMLIGYTVSVWFSNLKSNILESITYMTRRQEKTSLYVCEKEKDTPLWHRCSHQSEKSLYCDSGNGV